MMPKRKFPKRKKESRRKRERELEVCQLYREKLTPVVTVEKFHKILDAFLFASRDYSVDSRGDVGSWVRKVALQGLEKLLEVSICMLPLYHLTNYSQRRTWLLISRNRSS